MNSIDENDFNLETSYSNERLIEGKRCKKNQFGNKILIKKRK